MKCKIEWCSSEVGERGRDGLCRRHYEQKSKFGKCFRTNADKNDIDVDGDIAKVALLNRDGKIIDFAVIDKEDVEKINHIKWCKSKSGYAFSSNVTPHYMHKYIISGHIIDHIDGDRLNNRKSNLRVASCSQNSCNAKRKATNRSGYKGVTKASKNRWQVQVAKENKDYYVGLFQSKEEAASAYDIAAKKIHGEYARVNGISNETAYA